MDPGDEVLIPDPGYPTYQVGTILAGGRPRYYPVRAETGFLPDLAAIERQDLRRVRLMHINFGVMVTVNMAIGANTPPVGVDLIAACKVG
ncbi:MAG TPA: aminotransferase class I/II-fold pyridoxal phosphate-dependent enzyme, partial [Candidatus Methylomirabilis sp.]